MRSSKAVFLTVQSPQRPSPGALGLSASRTRQLSHPIGEKRVQKREGSPIAGSFLFPSSFALELSLCILECLSGEFNTLFFCLCAYAGSIAPSHLAQQRATSSLQASSFPCIILRMRSILPVFNFQQGSKVLDI
jgi:hypothetical protein